MIVFQSFFCFFEYIFKIYDISLYKRRYVNLKKVYLGIDIGAIFVKGVIIDKDNNIIVSDSLYVNENPINVVKKLISILKNRLNNNDYKVVSVGVTGSYRKLFGNTLGADVIKNEIICHSIGIMSLVKNVRTVIDIGGQDIKIIKLNDGRVIDYNIDNIYLSVFNDDLLLEGDKEKIIVDYLIDICKNKELMGLVSIHGGWSRNENVVRCIKELIKENVYIDKLSQYMGALGVAILAKSEKGNNYFDESVNLSALINS